MKSKSGVNPKIFLLILLALIFLFSFLTYWRFKEFGKSFSNIEPPKLELPKTELFPKPPQMEEKEFVSPDGKIKLKYGSDWRAMGEDGGLLDLSRQQLEGAKILFFAQKISDSFSFLSVQEMETAPEQKLEKIIDKIKGGATTSEMEIANLNVNETETEVVFEINYKKEGATIFHSKDKIVKTENKAYIASVLAFSEDWSSVEPEANKIIESVQILNK